MSAKTIPTEYLILGVLGIGALWWLTSGGAKTVGAAAVNAAADVAGGAVVALGQQVGIPATSASQCRIDLLAGNTLAASFSCPAGDFIAYELHGTIPP